MTDHQDKELSGAALALKNLRKAVDDYFGPSKVGEAWPTFFDSAMQAADSALAASPQLPVAQMSGDDLIQVTREDGNNYCRILSLLGMEEEGDPVAEVERLLAASHPSNAVQDAPVTIDDFHKHEVLDRTHVIQTMLNELLDGHPAMTPALQAFYEKSVEAVGALYQAAGNEHFSEPAATVPQVVQAPTLTDDERSALVKVKWSADNLCRTVNLSVDDIKSLAAMADRLAAPQPIAASPSIVPSDEQILELMSKYFDHEWVGMDATHYAQFTQRKLCEAIRALLTTTSNVGEAKHVEES